jgi:hypothetical protein
MATECSDASVSYTAKGGANGIFEVFAMQGFAASTALA